MIKSGQILDEEDHIIDKDQMKMRGMSSLQDNEYNKGAGDSQLDARKHA